MDRSLKEALSILSSLADITKQSLAGMKHKFIPKKPLIAAPTAAPTPRTTATLTSRTEYKPALSDKMVVEALLELKQKLGDKPPPEPSNFTPVSPPRVEATIKHNPLSRGTARKGDETAFPIYRSTKKDNEDKI
ncbi:MAG: hypothetical protein AABZ06_01755 [Bdellovibrionota bacterium]